MSGREGLQPSARRRDDLGLYRAEPEGGRPSTLELSVVTIERLLMLGKRGAVALTLARDAEALTNEAGRARVHDYIMGLHRQRTADVDATLAVLKRLTASPASRNAAFFAVLLERQREAWRALMDMLSGKRRELVFDHSLDYAAFAVAFLDESDVLPEVHILPSSRSRSGSRARFSATILRPLARRYYELANAALLRQSTEAPAGASTRNERAWDGSAAEEATRIARLSEVAGLLIRLARAEPKLGMSDELLVTAWRREVERRGSGYLRSATPELRVMTTLAREMALRPELRADAARVCYDMLEVMYESASMLELAGQLGPPGGSASIIEAPDIDYIDEFWELALGVDGRLSVRRHAGEVMLFQAPRLGPPNDTDIPGRDKLGTIRLRSLDRIEAVTASRRLGEALGSSVDSALVEARRARRVLCVRLGGEFLEFPAIPWELLSHNDGRSHFALDPMVRLMRCVPVRYALPPLTVAPPLRVLLVMASPDGHLALETRAELGTLLGAFDPAYWDVQICWRPSVRGLQQALAAHDPHVVHYIGHSAESLGQGFLILNAGDGGTDWISGRMLSRLLSPRVRLLCLSSPISVPNYQSSGFARIAHADLQQHLPTIVLDQSRVQREAARRFWSGFYHRVIKGGGNVINALHFARIDVACAGGEEIDWASFALVVRDGTGVPFRIRLAQRNIDCPDKELQASVRIHLANDLAELARRSSLDQIGARDLYALAEHEATEARAIADQSRR